VDSTPRHTPVDPEKCRGTFHSITLCVVTLQAVTDALGKVASSPHRISCPETTLDKCRAQLAGSRCPTQPARGALVHHCKRLSKVYFTVAHWAQHAGVSPVAVS